MFSPSRFFLFSLRESQTLYLPQKKQVAPLSDSSTPAVAQSYAAFQSQDDHLDHMLVTLQRVKGAAGALKTEAAEQIPLVGSVGSEMKDTRVAQERQIERLEEYYHERSMRRFCSCPFTGVVCLLMGLLILIAWI